MRNICLSAPLIMTPLSIAKAIIEWAVAQLNNPLIKQEYKTAKAVSICEGKGEVMISDPASRSAEIPLEQL